MHSKTVKYIKKIMYSDLMKCTMKINYNGIYIHVFTVCSILVTHMELRNFFHEIFTHIKLHLVPKINMIIKKVGLGEGFKL